MSHIGPSVTTVSSSESLPISSLTLGLLILVPCVVLLLLLNCILLGYKLLVLTKRKKKRRRLSSESTLVQSTLSAREIIRVSEVPSFMNLEGKGEYASISAPMLAQPVSSSLTSSRERAAVDQRIRITRPDGATDRGSGSLRAPSTILATMSTTGSTTRVDLPYRSQMYTRSSSDWRRSAPVLANYSDSETDRANTVPPNSPEMSGPPAMGVTGMIPVRRSSTMELQNEMTSMGVNSQDGRFQYEYADSSCFVASVNSSVVGPGLDSDFGASAGISLRILSSDSEGFSEAMWPSGLEWDYYDPCYVRKNHIPKSMHHIPTVSAKQYWV